MTQHLDPYPPDRPRAATIRSKVMLEVASELAGLDAWNPKQARVQFRRQGSARWDMTLFGSDAPSAIADVASGDVDFAILNPAAVAAAAIAGRPPFGTAIPLRAIATIPSYDQLGVAVHSDLGIGQLEELPVRAADLHISLRGERPDHSIHVVTDHLLGVLGTSLDDLLARGAVVSHVEGIPHQDPRRGAFTGGANVVIDEGIYNWAELATASGFDLLPITGETAASMLRIGYRESVLTPARFPGLAQPVPTIDFSGFLIYTHARVDDRTVRAFCSALRARSDRIPWQGGDSLPLARMTIDAIDAPVPIPFHPAAAAFWSELDAD